MIDVTFTFQVGIPTIILTTKGRVGVHHNQVVTHTVLVRLVIKTKVVIQAIHLILMKFHLHIKVYLDTSRCLDLVDNTVYSIKKLH